MSYINSTTTFNFVVSFRDVPEFGGVGFGQTFSPTQSSLICLGKKTFFFLSLNPNQLNDEHVCLGYDPSVSLRRQPMYVRCGRSQLPFIKVRWCSCKDSNTQVSESFRNQEVIQRLTFVPFYRGVTSKIGGWSHHMDVRPLYGCVLPDTLFRPPFD